MKNFKFKKIVVLLSIVMITVSCSNDFIEVSPQGASTEANFYKNYDDAKGALIAAYDVMGKESGGFENQIAMMNAGSDDHVAGGGGATDGAGIQSFSNYTISASLIPESFFNDYYKGIFRANTIIRRLPGIEMSVSDRNRLSGEAKALRSYFYFNLVRMFKNVPLITTDELAIADIPTITQASPQAVYAQIEQDLLEAIAVLPNSVVISSEAGRFTKGAAQALLGKVYLFENKNVDAAAMLANVNGTPGATNQYGNHLLANFSDLWIVSNKFNAESLLEVAHIDSHAYWGINWSGKDDGNALNIMVGPRSYSRTPLGVTNNAPTHSQGWSFNVITQDLYNVLLGDPRFNSTISNLKALETGGEINYLHGYQDTGYFLKKFMPNQSDVSTGPGNWELNFKQNTYSIRLADTYLMEAEALGASSSRALALVNAVRVRAGVAPLIALTMNDIKLERRKELAGEGHRFFDLVRWGDAPTKLASKGFVAGKNEIFPIPLSQLTNTKLVQNPGYN
ncbi:RagB/SusD family nutrient uptake outer membrane protein [Flavobacterium sp.]|uniref:RagB/SusD family nutrient uptake outer membrane protein n=1 Tax=Flavobacterium sp. TaxID=239 RepID=UPI0038FBFA49